MATKWCCNCERDRDESDFWLCSRNEDGLESVCIDCQKRRMRVIERNIAKLRGTPRPRKKYQPMDISSKFCYQCKQEKHISEFWVDASRTDGYNTVCKACGREAWKMRNKSKRLQNVTN